MKGLQSTIKQHHLVLHPPRNPPRKGSAPRSLSNERNAFRAKGLQVVRPNLPAATANVVTKERCVACEPLLQASFHAHHSAILKCLILKDEDGVQEFITSSMDKTMKFWKVEKNDIGGIVISTQTVEEGPVFSMVLDTYALDRPRSVYCGTSNKDVVCWEAPAPKIVSRDRLCMEGHSGWVRDLAIQDRWLFTCGCNHLLQWDLAWPMPKVVGDIELFTGDIQCIETAPGKVFAACANGSLRAWGLAKDGVMYHHKEVLSAHSSRIHALEYHEGVLYTAGSDGHIKAWDADTFELLQVIESAHDGQKINCAAISPDAVLYTGGNDNYIRAWRLPTLKPCAEPILHHDDGVRTLSASKGSLVSADSAGKISLWDISDAGACKV